MLLQSHAGEVLLLPALPRAWSSGYVKGLRARGGVEADFEWKDGNVTTLRLTSAQARPVQVRIKGVVQTIDTQRWTK